VDRIQTYIANNFVKDRLSGHFAALGSGLAELERRRARSTTNFTLLLSLVTLFIASRAFLVAFLDYSGDKTWQQKQIDSLEKIQENTFVLQTPPTVAQ
jgi:hypothetical protein